MHLPAPSTPRWAILQHVAHEGPGTIARVLADSGAEVAVTRLDLSEPLPDLADLEGLVVMGGPMGVHDGDDHPWLVAERILIGEAVESGMPVLGVCLGAQQLAAALGAEVTTGPMEEVGPGQVQLTAEGRRDPVLGPEYHGLSGTAVPCAHWHQDTFALPRGAVHLAASRAFPQQAFRSGDRVYGFQFHVEIDEQLAREWRPLLPDGVRLDEADVDRIGTVGARILRRFVDVAIADRSAAAAGVTP
jgi:GMP synthase-like glutamine amidotransferase